MNGQVLSSTVPVHRMYQILLIVFLYWEAGPLPAAPAKGSSALNTAPAHRMYQTLAAVFTYWEAGPLPDGS